MAIPDGNDGGIALLDPTNLKIGNLIAREKDTLFKPGCFASLAG